MSMDRLCEWIDKKPGQFALAFIAFVAIGGAVCLLSGCVSVGIPLPDGRMAHYTRVGSTSVDGIRVEQRDGSTLVVVEGYRSEGASLAEGVARGVASGLAK